VRRWLKDSNDIEEVVQDSLLKMYLGIDKIDEGRKFSSYLYAIARNEAISKLRRKKDTLPLLEYVVGEEGEKIYEKLITKENVDLLHKTLNKLGEMQKRVLKMYFFEELSYKRIQKRLGLNLNTVKTLLRRSKIDLAKRLTSAGMYISSH
jgi:RNA polymerase sigma-70 factor (ECF subfamily)